MKGVSALVAVIFCLPGFSCGYHTNARAVQLPSNVHTIAIPAFVNQSGTYRIEQILTGAVVREFVTRTNYHVDNKPDEGSDAILRGTVLATSAVPSAYDSQTGRAASVQVTVIMKVSLTDRQGKVLFENGSYIFRDQYQVSRELSSFFEEDTPALQRLSQEFARTLVSSILEGF